MKEFYRVGVKTNGKTVYHNIEGMDALVKFIANACADAERVSIVKQKLFTLSEGEMNY